MQYVAGAGLTLSLLGSLSQAKGFERMGEASQRAHDIAAKNQIAAGQRGALEEHRKGKLLVSRALAVAAASGGGVDDPTVVNIIADIKGESAYRAAVAMYEGEDRAAKLEYEGRRLKFEGKAKKTATVLSGLGDAALGGAHLKAKYGKKTSYG